MRLIYALISLFCSGTLAISANASEPLPMTAPQTGAACGQTLATNGSGNLAPAPRRGFVGRIIAKGTSPEHRRGPDGCPTPVGCGSFYTEFKFVFGSCRQYFGTGDSSRGTCSGTTVPPPNRLP